MANVIEKQKQIVDTKDIKIVIDWLKEYYSLEDEIKEENPLFCNNGVEFNYFEDGNRQDSRFDINYGKSDYQSVDFDDLVSMGLNEFIIEKGFKNTDEVYQTDINYTFEIIYRVDIVDEFISKLENK